MKKLALVALSALFVTGSIFAAEMKGDMLEKKDMMIKKDEMKGDMKEMKDDMGKKKDNMKDMKKDKM